MGCSPEMGHDLPWHTQPPGPSIQCPLHSTTLGPGSPLPGPMKLPVGSALLAARVSWAHALRLLILGSCEGLAGGRAGRAGRVHGEARRLCWRADRTGGLGAGWLGSTSQARSGVPLPQDEIVELLEQLLLQGSPGQGIALGRGAWWGVRGPLLLAQGARFRERGLLKGPLAGERGLWYGHPLSCAGEGGRSVHGQLGVGANFLIYWLLIYRLLLFLLLLHRPLR